MVQHVIDGFTLNVDRGPNWLLIKLRRKQKKLTEISHLADQLWSIAARHFIYRLVLELEELDALPPRMIDQLVRLQERLSECGGALRICGLSSRCAEALRERDLDAALPNYATRQAAVLGTEASAFRQRLREVMSTAADADAECEMVDAPLAGRQPCLQ